MPGNILHHESSTVVELLPKGRGNHPLPVEENLGIFVTAMFNMPHIQVKPSCLIHVQRNRAKSLKLVTFQLHCECQQVAQMHQG